MALKRGAAGPKDPRTPGPKSRLDPTAPGVRTRAKPQSIAPAPRTHRHRGVKPGQRL